MKRVLITILLSGISAIVFGIIGLTQFIKFSGNGCVMPDPDPTCQCFCCHLFGLRGYESCGNLGLLVGAVFGIILVLVIYKLIKK